MSDRHEVPNAGHCVRYWRNIISGAGICALTSQALQYIHKVQSLYFSITVSYSPRNKRGKISQHEFLSSEHLQHESL